MTTRDGVQGWEPLRERADTPACPRGPGEPDAGRVVGDDLSPAPSTPEPIRRSAISPRERHRHAADLGWIAMVDRIIVASAQAASWIVGGTKGRGTPTLVRFMRHPNGPWHRVIVTASPCKAQPGDFIIRCDGSWLSAVEHVQLKLFKTVTAIPWPLRVNGRSQ